eukprot:scaffold1574_cov119-Isochrysis_galbana.AAC.5
MAAGASPEPDIAAQGGRIAGNSNESSNNHSPAPGQHRNSRPARDRATLTRCNRGDNLAPWRPCERAPQLHRHPREYSNIKPIIAQKHEPTTTCAAQRKYAQRRDARAMDTLRVCAVVLSTNQGFETRGSNHREYRDRDVTHHTSDVAIYRGGFLFWVGTGRDEEDQPSMIASRLIEAAGWSSPRRTLRRRPGRFHGCDDAVYDEEPANRCAAEALCQPRLIGGGDALASPQGGAAATLALCFLGRHAGEVAAAEADCLGPACGGCHARGGRGALQVEDVSNGPGPGEQEEKRKHVDQVAEGAVVEWIRQRTGRRVLQARQVVAQGLQQRG